MICDVGYIDDGASRKEIGQVDSVIRHEFSCNLDGKHGHGGSGWEGNLCLLLSSLSIGVTTLTSIGRSGTLTLTTALEVLVVDVKRLVDLVAESTIIGSPTFVSIRTVTCR